MKYKSVNHWNNIQEQEGLLFFAQIIDECLFDYALPTFKPSALNSRLLCIELLQTIENVENGLIKEPNIKFVIQELKWSLDHDVAAQAMLGKYLPRFLKSIDQYEAKPKELKNTIELLYNHFNDRKYLRQIQALLNEKIPLKKEKKVIYHLTKTLITELINYGYHQNSIYHKTNQYFFNPSKPVIANDPNDFFANFDFKKKKFDVIFKGSKVFKEFQKTAKARKIALRNSLLLNTTNPQAIEFVESKRDDEIFIISKNIEALDIHKARINSENPLLRLGAFFSFYHHKGRPAVSDKCLVIPANEELIVLDKAEKSIIKKADIHPKVAAQLVQTMFQNLKLPATTVYTISRAIELHSVALEAEDLENKLLNLWTAFEILVPKAHTSGVDRIVQLLSAITPFQVNGYFNTLINETKRDFWYCDKTTSNWIVKNVKVKQKESLNVSVAAFLTAAENEDERKKVYADLDRFPLLRFRIFQLNSDLMNGASAKKLLSMHQQKIEWQIRRIYRTRNLIVHSGKLPSYTNILVENLHNYFDSFLETFIRLAITEQKIKTIAQGIVEVDFKTKNHFETLTKHEDASTSLDNFKQLIYDE